MAQSPLPPLDDSHNNTENSSPSDFHSSVEASPAIVPLSGTPASDGGHSPSSSSTRPSPYQHRNSLDLQRSSVSTAGRGGCWCVFVPQTSYKRARLYVLILFFVPPLGPAVSDEKYVFRWRVVAPSTWSILTHRPAFPASCALPLSLPRNATNSAKKVTLVVPAAVCNSNA